MEKMNFVRNGVSRLPPGFRFQPTDHELVFQYLKCKIFSLPLPASIIPDLNLCNFDPWDLPGNSDEEERYFFSPKGAKYRNGNRMNRTTISGYWKATGSDKKITSSSRNNDIVGIRKALVFYEGNSPSGSKTDWIMHEYRLVTASSSKSEEVGDWVLCRIFLKKTTNNGDTRRTRSHVQDNSNTRQDMADQPRFFDFMMLQNQNLHASTSRSCSSSNGCTELSSNYVSDHEETSGFKGF
ncbi:NAC domain-containing protein 83-like [Prosopis cineraria]|uniref:NAC domain-containing protein 83-like n=1 Tax=Prosopis cineraria TaxID=364024 RepID=UPI00240EA94A|nr:NAC domain-containing protein 83-like [Prosopis cineraria]